MVPNRNLNVKEWRCCFGLLHVRTGTLVIGLWHLMLNVLAITLLAVIIKNPTMVNDFNTGLDYSEDSDLPMLPTPLSKIDAPIKLDREAYAYRDHSMNYQDMDMGGLVCLCMIAITLMLIYGTIKGKASHLLPFFFLQLCDFAITTLTAAGYICYLRTIHHLIADSPRMPWRDELVKVNPRTLGVAVLFAFIFMVMLKAYAIGIVWRCYKYLTLRQHNASMLPYIIPDSHQERSYNSLLPDYDEAIAQSLKIAPPPSYQVAVAMQTQQTTVDVGVLPMSAVASPIHDQQPSTSSARTSEGDNISENTEDEQNPPSYTAAQEMESSQASPVIVTIPSNIASPQSTQVL